MASFKVTYWTPKLHLEHLREKSNENKIKDLKKYIKMDVLPKLYAMRFRSTVL
jgi:hypothetical protein